MNLPLVRPLVEAFRLFASSLLSSTVIPSDGINPPSNFRDGNIVFSPMGVSSVLAILRLAAGTLSFLNCKHSGHQLTKILLRWAAHDFLYVLKKKFR